jgi:hypothetical protein
MSTANFYAPGFDQEVEQQNIDRQRKMADLLRQQSMEPMDKGQMVGGHFVAPSFTQGLAKMLQGYYAGQDSKEADSRQKSLAEALKTRTSSEMGQFTDMLTGRPADVLPEGEQGPARSAQAPDLSGAYKFAAGAQTPALQQFGVQGALTNAQEQAKLAQAKALQSQQLQLWQASGNDPQKFMQIGGDPKFAKEMAESPTWGKKRVVVNGQLVDEATATPVGAAIPKQVDAPNPASDLLVPDPSNPGKLIPNTQLVGIKESLALKGSPKVSVDARNYSTQESEQSKKYGASLGEIRSNINQAGWDAPKQLANLDRMETLLKGVDGGGAAPSLAAVASLANSFGIKIDPSLGPKEASIALAKEMAGALRKPGTGPMTDKDFDNFLAQIPDLSKSAEGRKQIMTTMRAATNRDLAAAKFARDYARQNKGVIDDNFFDAMAGFYAKNPVVTPAMPATNAKGIPFSVEAIDAELAKRQGGGAR